MRAQRRRDTAAEMALRREAHRLGLRYVVDKSPLPGVRRRADMVFTGQRVAVFVDGCFWHSCPVHRSSPRSNADWWAEKLAGNVRRDRDTNRRLEEAGWMAVRFWEHEDPAEAAALLAGVIEKRRHVPR